MKIIVFSQTFFPKSQTFVYKQTKGFINEGHEVVLLGFETANKDLFPIQARTIIVPAHTGGVEKFLYKVLRRVFSVYRTAPAATRRLKAALIAEQPDVIHAHFGYSALLIYPIARQLRIPLVVTFHGIDASPNLLRQAYYTKGLTDMLDYASQIIVVSRHMIGTLDIAHKKNVNVIPCYVNADDFNSAGEREPDGLIRILHSGRICAKKGVPDLVRVFARLHAAYPETRLVLAGTGEEMNETSALVPSLGLAEVVEMTGALSNYEVRELMGTTDIFVLNSRTAPNGDMEGTPVSLMEAMSMEIAVVSTYHAGIPDLVHDGEGGLLVAEKDNEGLYQALERLVVDPGLRQKLAHAGRQTILDSFDERVLQPKINEVMVKCNNAVYSTATEQLTP